MNMTMTVALLCMVAGSAVAQTRLPAIPPDQYDAEQKEAARAFEAARGKPVFGPFEALMYSPRVMTDARAMGDYLRFQSKIGNTLSELAILVTARAWSQDYEWSLHAPIAAKAGVPEAVIAAIREGRRPEAMSEDEAIVYDFSDELHRNRQVSDATYRRAEARFGRPGVVDLTGINGYYTLLAMQLNMARYGLAPGGTGLPRLPE